MATPLMCNSVLFVREDARQLADIVGAAFAPWDGRRVLIVKDLDIDAVHDQVLPVVFCIRGDGLCEPLVDRVVLELIDHVVQVHERGH